MTSQKLTRLGRMLSLLPSVILLQSCVTTTGSGGISAPPELKRAAFCDVAQPISWSRRDTPETVLEIKAKNNAPGISLCAWKAK